MFNGHKILQPFHIHHPPYGHTLVSMLLVHVGASISILALSLFYEKTPATLFVLATITGILIWIYYLRNYSVATMIKNYNEISWETSSPWYQSLQTVILPRLHSRDCNWTEATMLSLVHLHTLDYR